MPEQQQYKCLRCGGALAFDSDIQKMKCPYCDTEFDVQTLRSYDDILNQKDFLEGNVTTHFIEEHYE